MCLPSASSQQEHYSKQRTSFPSTHKDTFLTPASSSGVWEQSEGVQGRRLIRAQHRSLPSKEDHLAHFTRHSTQLGRRRDLSSTAYYAYEGPLVWHEPSLMRIKSDKLQCKNCCSKKSKFLILLQTLVWITIIWDHQSPLHWIIPPLISDRSLREMRPSEAFVKARAKALFIGSMCVCSAFLLHSLFASKAQVYYASRQLYS